MTNPIYRRRLLAHRFGIAMSFAAMLFGLVFLAWILADLLYNGFGALNLAIRDHSLGRSLPNSPYVPTGSTLREIWRSTFAQSRTRLSMSGLKQRQSFPWRCRHRLRLQERTGPTVWKGRDCCE